MATIRSRTQLTIEELTAAVEHLQVLNSLLIDHAVFCAARIDLARTKFLTSKVTVLTTAAGAAEIDLTSLTEFDAELRDACDELLALADVA